MNKRKIGMFRIHPEFLFDGDQAALKLMFGKMIVLEARHDYRTRSVEYIAVSDMFEPIEEGCCAPQYEIIFKRVGKNLLISSQRCDPAPVLNFSLRNKIARLKMAIKAFLK